MPRSLLVAFLTMVIACAEPAEPEGESTVGAESASEERVAEPEAAVFGLQGVAEPVAGAEPPSEAEREAARVRRDAERRARTERCRGVVVPHEPRPPMPALAPAASLADRERVYREGRATPAPVPADGTMAAHQIWGEALGEWLRHRIAAIAALEEGAADLAPAERAIAAAWVAHSYLDIVEAFDAPAPDPVAADPELHAVYRQTILDQVGPLVERAKQAVAFCSVHAEPPLTAHCVEMEAFAAGVACR